jgi:pSer/pThr/pTyr-binding forkhead associated (FHA) protein
MLKLRFKNNKHSAVWLVEPKVTIGRANGNHLIVEDPKAAPRHADILVNHEQLTLVNVAGHSLLVNGEPVEKSVVLQVNDQVRIGNTLLEVIDPKLEQRTTPPAVAGNNPAWALKANHAALANRLFPINVPPNGEVIIGRSTDCDITLAAAHLSRHHAKLVMRDGLLYIRDLGSANGTFLNGERITEARIRRGDELRLDTLSFSVLGPSSEDLDKTTVRPMPAIAPRPDAGKATQAQAAQAASKSARPTQVQRPPKNTARTLNEAALKNAVAMPSGSGTSKGKRLWVWVLLGAIALAASLAWQWGVISG